MAYTEQQAALQRVKTLFGDRGFTEDHACYRKVGFPGLSAIGETWDEAIINLQAKVNR